MASNLSFGPAVLLAFWAVLVAELVGDKSLYALASLTMRFHWLRVFAAYAAASAGKMMVAALLGGAIMRFSSHWTYLISGVAFFISAVLIWVDESPAQGESSRDQDGWSGALVCFSSFFLTEWSDPGQIAAAALVLKSHLPLATWLGATLALMVKGAAVLTLSLQMRNRLPQRTLRILASACCCALGMIVIGEGVIS